MALASEIQNLPAGYTPPSPQPQKIVQQFGSGISSNYDFDEIVDVVDLLSGLDAEQGRLVAVLPTHLAVEVRATMLAVDVVVERGNNVTFLARFSGEPDEVFFSYLKPGSQRPHVDPGFGEPGSSIRRVGEGIYAFIIDTSGFRGGVLQWHFWGAGAVQGSEFGEVVIPDRPAQLL